jgi:hypothetical protein
MEGEMVDYSIAAIPTEYKGRMYRSRLEARWAAFFDRLSWGAEYEPFDLGAWSPDFLLRHLNVLVEVKPITTFDGATWNKMSGTCAERGLFKDGDDQIGGILLTLLAPQITNDKVIQLGWFICPADTDADLTPLRAWLGWIPALDEPRCYADIVGIRSTPRPHGAWFSITERGGPLSPSDLAPQPYVEYSMKLWAQSTADVQWQPASE